MAEYGEILMENPATWGPAEKIINATIKKNQEETGAFGRIGWSLAKQITEALRSAGLLADTSKVNRFEVINHTGERLDTWSDPGRVIIASRVPVALSLQDNDETLKVFLGDGS